MPAAAWRSGCSAARWRRIFDGGALPPIPRACTGVLAYGVDCGNIEIINRATLIEVVTTDHDLLTIASPRSDFKAQIRDYASGFS